MAKEGRIIEEWCWGEVRSIAIHFPSRSKKHRVTSVAGSRPDLARSLLEYIVSILNRAELSVASLREMCVSKKKELQQGTVAKQEDRQLWMFVSATGRLANLARLLTCSVHVRTASLTSA